MQLFCRKLLEKDFTVSDVQAVVDKLQKEGLQSDSRYTEMIVRVRFNKGYGPNYIKAYLHEKGVAANLINDKLEPYHALWIDKLIETFQRKYVHTMPSFDKAYRFLAQRGFVQADIRRVYFDLNEKRNA